MGKAELLGEGGTTGPEGLAHSLTPLLLDRQFLAVLRVTGGFRRGKGSGGGGEACLSACSVLGMTKRHLI